MARINGTELSDILIGTAENDIILGYGGNDSLSGLSGNDHLNGGSGSDELAGGAGNDVYKVDVFVGDEVIVTDLLGVFSNFGIVLELLGDTVRVEVNLDGQIQILTVAIAQIQPRDQVGENAGEGRDRVVTNVSYVLPANVENLTLTGRHPTNGTGNVAANVITGNSAANTINGDAGNDVLRGMTGWDTLIGGEGADRVNGGIGADDMRGGAGNDTYRVDNSGDSVQEAASAGIDRVISTISFVLPENVEHLTLLQTAPLSGTGNGLNNAIVGNGGANVIDGLGGDDWIDGRVGNDTLNGGPGNDLIRAGFGADRVNGGPGNDRLTGDTGPDTFVFDSALNGRFNVDRITDFEVARDTIELDQTVFAALTLGTLSADAFHTGTAAQDAEDRIIYDSATGRIFYDADGSGPGAQLLFAQVNAGIPLTNADFLIAG